MDQYIDVVFDGPPSSEGGRFVEVENEQGLSINAGKWIECPEDGHWRLRLKVKPGLNNLAELIHQRATASGFWPEDKRRALEALLRVDLDLNDGGQPNDDIALINHYISSQEVRNMGEMLMLAVSELAEGLEEHRDGKPVVYHKITVGMGTTLTQESAEALANIRRGVAEAAELGMLEDHEPDPEDVAVLVKHGIAKPEGLAVELADCIIRCLDTMKSLDVDIDAIVAEKMAYNASRSFKHGKAY